MFERYTEKARRTIFFAAEEADRLGHRSVGTEHLLLGMLLMKGSLAAEILQARGLKLTQIRRQLQIIAAAAIKPRWQGSALPKLEDFLSGLKRHGSQELLPFFATNAHFVDASGKVWNREEIGTHFETLFILYAKKKRILPHRKDDTRHEGRCGCRGPVEERDPRKYGARVDAPDGYYSGSRRRTMGDCLASSDSR
jgi:hypothetical protein